MTRNGQGTSDGNCKALQAVRRRTGASTRAGATILMDIGNLGKQHAATVDGRCSGVQH